MDLFKWKDEFSVGIQQLDEDHKKLIEYLNEVYNMMLNKANKDEIIHVLTGLKSYTVQHFSNEETLFEEYSYPDMSKHKLEHKDFVGKVEDFFKGYNSGKLMLNMEVMNFLKDWLRTHINGSDRAYKDYLTGKGAR